ncbi:MAG: Glucoamylase [Candidatus Alkanophagales archaeon MCA70_species_2]|nr:Glucoamylase [Candidatus Alkanophaga liquidiphilum]
MNEKKADKLYRHSITVIKENQHKNGGFYASPPGTRYPYIYTRDHSVITLGALDARMFKEARRALVFILDAQKPSGEFSQRYDTDGVDTSYKDLQIDGNGLVLFTLGKYYEVTKDDELCIEFWDVIERAVEYILRHKNDEIDLIHTLNSIHEYPAYEHGFEIFANAACCAGIFAAVKMGKALDKDVRRWEKEAEKVKNAIFTRLWSSRLRSFIKNIRIKHQNSKPLGYDPLVSVVTDVDVVEYSPAYFGLIADDDLRIVSTARRIHRALWDEELGGLNRYPEYWDRNNGGYGPWPHFTLQLARHFINIGDEDTAEQYIGWCVEIAYEDLLPEHISTIERFELWLETYRNANILTDKKLVMINGIKQHPKWKDGFAYVTTPLLWPHAEYIRTYSLWLRTFR